MKRLILIAVLCTTACGGSSPTAPSSPPPPVTPPAPITVTITGHVTATNGGQPLAGVSAALGSTNATTDGSGSFSTSMPPQASVSLALTGASIVPRTIRVAATNTRDVTADAIMLGGGFDLGFYRQLVRDALETPNSQPLRRWTRAPSIYLMTVDDAGGAVDAKTLNTTETALRESVPAWTSGAFGVATLERGTDTRKGQAGWITVTWVSSPEPIHCGQADVAREGGTIDLNYRNPMCRCAGGPELRPMTVRHEVGHAMGFWHTDNVNDLMYGQGKAGCDAQPSARERLHAAIAYSRPVGNQDPDSDQFGPVYLAPMRVQ